jgi:redox-sensitive bicupin YhaK (pirin superfamily)
LIEAIHPSRPPSGGGLPGFEVVPDSKGRMVGPFALLASIGPATLPPGIPKDADARPHPHIGMGVLAYIKSGEITHRDDLGNVYRLRGGETTWMMCGGGIVHSERLETLRAHGGLVDGLVAFVALPDDAEQLPAECRHVSGEAIPTIEAGGATGRLLLGSAQGVRAEVQHPSPAYLIHWTLEPGARLSPQVDYSERAFHVVAGKIELGGEKLAPGQMVTLIPGAVGSISAPDGGEVIEFGGEPVGPRYRWWNYIASRVELIEAAKRRWLDDNRSLPPGETEFTPLPADDERELQLLSPGASIGLPICADEAA